MPLTGEEKNQIALGAQLVSGTLPFPIIGGTSAELALSDERQAAQSIQQIASALPFPFNFLSLPLVAGLTALLTRDRAPQLSPSDIGRAARLAGEGFVISSDPFFGDVVISTPDQAQHLVELVRESAIRRVIADQTQDSRLFLERKFRIERLAETAEARGFDTMIDPDFRGAAFRATADSPLQVIERDVFL